MSTATFLWDRDILIAAAAMLVSLILQRAYLRAVRRSMLRSSPVSGQAVRDVSQPTHLPGGAALAPLQIGEWEVPGQVSIRAAGAGPRHAAAVQIVAGFLYGLIVALAWAWLAQQLAPDRQFTLQGIVMFTLFFAWPAVIVVGLVASASWRAMALVALAYAALLVPIAVYLMQGTQITLAVFAHSWWNINGPATLFVLAFLLRPIRAMGPIVSALMVAAAAGVFAMASILDETKIAWLGDLADNIRLSGKPGAYVVAITVFGSAALVAALAGYIALLGLGRLYQARLVSDQSIQIDAVWLTFAILQAPHQLPLAGLAGFVLYKLIAWLGTRLTGSGGVSESTAPRLLLLRVFSLGARSSRLFDSFARLWRHTGSVRMIAGPDLANSTVEPHEFLDFLAGRLQRRFITGPAVLEQRLAETQQRRDPDGRFRVSSFFCHDDTWRMVLRRLAHDSDLVLMDLRGFSPANRGCIYEINELLETVDLERFLLVVDATTDERFLTEVLKQGWAAISSQSKNWHNSQPRVRLYRLDDTGRRWVDRLVATLATAHDRGLTH